MLGCVSYVWRSLDALMAKGLYLNVIQSCWAFSVKPCCHSSYRPHICLYSSKSLFVSSAREKSGVSRLKQAQSSLEKVTGTGQYWM